MSVISTLRDQIQIHKEFVVTFVSITVGAHGVFILANTLLSQISIHHGPHLSDFVVDLPLLIGLTLFYVSTRLRSRKYNAWVFAVCAYAFYLGIGVTQLAIIKRFGTNTLLSGEFFREIFLPLSILVLLVETKSEFIVQSDFQSFRSATKFSIAVLVVAFLYGVAGFTLLDKHDFHQEITFNSAAHYTVDRFDLTTTKPLELHTRRAHLFVDSLSFISIAAFSYVLLSFFGPIRSRYSDQSKNRQLMAKLLNESEALSEDFFMIWPNDKQYFFNATSSAALAYRVERGVALCLGGPIGAKNLQSELIKNFKEFCYRNGWLVAFVHTTKLPDTVTGTDFSAQKLGEEAVVTVNEFNNNVVTNKHFRHIKNKFTKLGYTTALLAPPHSKTVMRDLQYVSDDWLSRNGRVERGFVMGRFSEEYMQQCNVFVARDQSGTITAFLNQVPAEFDRSEATYDLLRNTTNSPSNCIDYLLLCYIQELENTNYNYLNMGLCPLAGVGDDSNNVVDTVFRFAYANGDRFFSFSGLHRFKSKYEPTWRPRYIVYQGGLIEYSRVINALLRAMRIRN